MSQETILPDCQMPDGAEPCKGYLQLQETAIQIAGDKHALKDQVRVLREALQDLLDEQDGPPLHRRRREWQRAVDQARAALPARGESAQ